MTNLKEVLDFIKNSELEDFSKIRFAVNVRRSELTNDKKESFRVGDKVSIDHKKVDRNAIFTITKINNKMIKVTDSKGSKFNVSPGLLIKK